MNAAVFKKKKIFLKVIWLVSHENVPQPSLNPIRRSFSGYTAATRPLMLVICHTCSSVAALTCAPAAPSNPEASHNLWKWAGSGNRCQTDTGTPARTLGRESTLPMYLRMWLANLWRPPVPVTGRSSLYFLSGEVAHCPLKGKFAQKLKLHIFLLLTSSVVTGYSHIFQTMKLFFLLSSSFPQSKDMYIGFFWVFFFY